MAMRPKKEKPRIDFTAIWHEGRKLEMPILAAPVGQETPALRARYPSMNRPKDVGIVDYYLSAIEAVKALTPSQTASTNMAMQRLFGIVQKNIPWDQRSEAIRALQAHCAITDPAEKQDGLILPGKDTLKSLVDLGDIAEKLLGNDDAPGSRYMQTGNFDWIVFSREFSSRFHGQMATHGLAQLLGMMERDPYVLDIRWMAYMLATTSIETGWKFTPVEEDGGGNLGKYKDPQKPKLYGKLNVKSYYLPVKVRLLPDGQASVTEYDGDQFTVQANGAKFVAVGSGKRGAEAVDFATQTFKKPTDLYTKEKGVEHAYFGRGYCQLTGWNNYATAGYVLGRGLDFLFDPDLVLEPKVAYEIMSVGMRTGTIFANEFRISRFISGNHCDYLHARQLVNGMNGAKEVADIAKKFEAVLMASTRTLLAGH